MVTDGGMRGLMTTDSRSSPRSNAVRIARDCVR
jgi:hypothetical protein